MKNTAKREMLLNIFRHLGVRSLNWTPEGGTPGEGGRDRVERQRDGASRDQAFSGTGKEEYGVRRDAGEEAWASPPCLKRPRRTTRTASACHCISQRRHAALS